jgi:hypothetical protein
MPHQDLILIDRLPEIAVYQAEQGRFWLQTFGFLRMGMTNG